MSYKVYIPYLLVMAGVTYLIRAIPLALIQKKINNRFIRSFLYYVPYTVLSSMTFPAILYATGNMISAAAGMVAAMLIALRTRSLVIVAAGACAAVLIVELILMVA
jgi:branched-subunit amino acid transport protein